MPSEIIQGLENIAAGDRLTSSQRGDQKMEHPERETEESQEALRDASSLKAFLMKSDAAGGPNL